MEARDVMTREVITARPDTPVPEIARLMMTHEISGVPVIDASGALVGLVSEGDLLRRVEPGSGGAKSWWLRLFTDEAARDFVRTEGRHARDVMTTALHTVAPDTPLGEVARTLEKHRIKRVPVVEGGRLVGIVSRANLLHGIAANPAPAPASGAEDRQLRDAVLSALRDVPGVAGGNASVVVVDGRAEIWGTVHEEAEREAMRIAAENVPGVREVTLHVAVVPVAGYWV